MFIGIAEVELYIPYAGSLKEKRRVLKKIIDNTKNKFPVSIAEVDCENLWQRSVVGISMVSNDKNFIEKVLQKISFFIDQMGICEIISFKKEIFNW